MTEQTDHLIRAPWTSEQVAALNEFQQYGGMHPFTCGNDQHDVSVVLMAHRDGWHCSDPACGYRQDWAHAFMADRGRAVSSAGPAPADRDALRERIVQVLRTTPSALGAENPQLGFPSHHQPGESGYLGWCALCVRDIDAIADAVLAVLPAPVDRAAVLLEAADELDRYVGKQSSDAAPEVAGARLVIRELRRIAGHPSPVEEGKCGCYSPSRAYRCTQPAGHLGYHRHTQPDTDEWSSWITGTTEAELRRMAGEAPQDEASDDEGDELVCVDMCGSCDACGMEPFGTPAVARPGQPETDEETPFGIPGCTCKPWTTEDGKRRFMEPGETVDRISGWYMRPDCPHHKPAADTAPPRSDHHDPT